MAVEGEKWKKDQASFLQDFLSNSPVFFFLPLSYTLFIFSSSLNFLPVLDNWILMVDLPDYRIILNCKASIQNIPSL